MFSSSETIRNVQCNYERFRFADTQESCFEVWKRSHMGCTALLFGRFADSQESRFQVLKRSNMISAILKGGRSVDIHEFCFKLQNFQLWSVSNCMGVYLFIFRNGIFRY